MKLEPLETRTLLAVITVTASDANAAEEGEDPGTFLVARDPAENYISDVYFTLGGSATSDDYEVTGATNYGDTYHVVFEPNVPSKAITIRPFDDARDDDLQDVIINLTEAYGGCCCGGSSDSIGAPSSATITITDNDDWTISLSATTAGLVEADLATQGTYTIERTGGTDMRYAITVDFVMSGAAEQGQDYWLKDSSGGTLSNSIDIPAGQTQVAVELFSRNDSLKEANEEAVLTLSDANSSGVTCGAGCGCGCGCWHVGGQFGLDPAANSASITITDDDNWEIKVDRTSPDNIVEQTGEATFTFTKVDKTPNGNADPNYGITVEFSMSGDASEVMDYLLRQDTNVISPDEFGIYLVTIEEGESTAELTLDPQNDPNIELDELAILTVDGAKSVLAFMDDGSGGGYWMGGGNPFSADSTNDSASVKILDDDHWEISLVELGTPGVPRTVIKEEGETTAYYDIMRTHEVMTPARPGDTSYRIIVTLSESGEAFAFDYRLFDYMYLPDGTWSESPPWTNGMPFSWIQAGQVKRPIKIQAVDDNYVEPLVELLEISVTRAYNDGETQDYVVVQGSGVEFDIEDNDELSLDWSEFQGHLNMIADPGSGLTYPANDPPVGQQENPSTAGIHHWEDIDGDGTVEDTEKFPVAYASGSDVLISSQFLGSFEPQYVGEEIQIHGLFTSIDPDDTSGSTESIVLTATIGTGGVTISGEKLFTLIDDMALYLEDFTIDWESAFSVDVDAAGATIWRDAGVQTTPLYATYKAAVQNEFHTVIHIGSKQAHGIRLDLGNASLDTVAEVDQAVIDAIWAEFSDRDVERVDGTQLVYYGPTINHGAPSPLHERTTAGLLQFAAGRCGAWGHFFTDVVLAQGIGAQYGEVVPKPRPDLTALGFDVKPTLDGQGDTPPGYNLPFLFQDHALVVIGGVIYDPSYGGTPYTSLIAWENANLDRCAYLNANNVPEFFANDPNAQDLVWK